MKIQSSPDDIQEMEHTSSIFPITLKGMLWVLLFVLGLLLSLLLSITSLTIWVLTRNLFYLVSSLFSGGLFIIWGYINLKEKKPSTSQV